MSTAARTLKRRSPDEAEGDPDKDGSPSGQKKRKIGAGAPQTPSAQNMNINGTLTAPNSTMPPPPILQQGLPGGQQSQQPSQPQQAQMPQGQPPSTPHVQPRFPPGPVMSVVHGQQRPGAVSGVAGPMGGMGNGPLTYPNPGVINPTRVSLSGAAGVPGTPSGIPIPNTGPMVHPVGRGFKVNFFWSLRADSA
jgi:hypothetical protein